MAHDLRNLPAMEQQLGSEIRCAVVFSDNMDTWEQWERPWFAYSPHEHFQWERWVRDSGGEKTLVMTFNMIPKQVPEDWRARGAAGDYDGHVRALAQNLVDRGLGRSVIRLGAEMNGDWRIDQVGDTQEQRREWAQYWARIVKVMRSVPGADFTFDWNVNGGYRPIPLEEYYPGDDVVDVIGVDQYDSLWEQKTANRFSEIYHQRGGMRDVSAFARAHRKPMSLPEVGLVSSTARGGGDNPAYVDGLQRFVRDNQVVYVGYFNHRANGVLRLQEVPRSAREWHRSIDNGDALFDLLGGRLDR